MRAKLFRFRSNEWKERGVGEVKLLRHKTNFKIRLIQRQDKTLKPCANFFSKLIIFISNNLVSENPLCEIKEHMGNDKMLFLMANDCSEEAPELEKLVFKFGNTESK